MTAVLPLMSTSFVALPSPRGFREVDKVTVAAAANPEISRKIALRPEMVEVFDGALQVLHRRARPRRYTAVVHGDFRLRHGAFGMVMSMGLVAAQAGTPRVGLAPGLIDLARVASDAGAGPMPG